MTLAINRLTGLRAIPFEIGKGTSRIIKKYTVNGLRLQANIASAVLTCTTFCYKYISKGRKNKKPRNKQRNKDTR